MSSNTPEERAKEDRQAWDFYFAEAYANSARYRAATIGTRVHTADTTADELLEKCAVTADKMLAIRRKRFE